VIPESLDEYLRTSCGVFLLGHALRAGEPLVSAPIAAKRCVVPIVRVQSTRGLVPRTGHISKANTNMLSWSNLPDALHILRTARVASP